MLIEQFANQLEEIEDYDFLAYTFTLEQDNLLEDEDTFYPGVALLASRV